MATESDRRRLLPIACALGPADAAERLDDWRKVAAVAAAGRSLTRGKLTLRFRDGPTIGSELARLVAAERDCCAFLGWNLVQADEEWLVEITGADSELSTLPLTW